MHLRLLLLTLACLFLPASYGQMQWVEVKGTASDYAGLHLVLKEVVNPISLETRDLMIVPVHDDGTFTQSIEICKVTHATVYMGRYQGHIYLEPGQTYELVLPPYEPRSDADRFNPFFTPEEIVLGIVNNDAMQLNENIIEFSRDLDKYYNAEAVNIFRTGNKARVEQIINQLDSLYPSDNNQYLQRYKQYALGELLSIGYKRNKRTVMQRTMGDALPYYNMPSFIKSFNVLFKSFFTYYFPSKYGKTLRESYASGASYDTLATIIKADKLFHTDELAELVLLKGLYDAFYSGRYEEERIINLFNEASQKACSLELKDIAKGLFKKVTWLRKGTQAPDFTLYSLDGKERSLSDYEGKFVYLNFMHTSNHTCKEDLEVLNVISKQMRRDLRVLTIILDEDPTAAKALIKKQKYRWDFLHYAAMPRVLLDYHVKSTPLYFVIDPTQRLSLTPAPSPQKDFVPIFTKTMRSFNYNQLRKNKPKQKNIYDF